MTAFTYERIPADLRAVPAWVLWRKVWLEDKGKWSKVPVQANGYPASVTNPAHHCAYDTALFAYQMGVADGIGFCFSESDDFIFVDLDGAVVDGAWNPAHLPIMQAFATWAEMSQSGVGVHFICRGRLDRARVHHPAGLELYSANRFVAMTGWQLEGWPTEITDQQASVDQLAAYIDQLKGSAGVREVEPAGETPLLSDVVPALDSLRIGPEVRDFLLNGNADKWENDRSRALLAAAMSLYRTGLSDSQVLTVLWYHCGHIAREHRVTGNPLDWLWKYNVAPGRTAAPPDTDTLFASIPVAQSDQLTGLLERIGQLAPLNSGDTASIQQARAILAESFGLDAGSRIAVRDGIRSAMRWSKGEITEVLKEIEREVRRQRNDASTTMDAMMSDFIYVASSHVFLHKPSGEEFKPEAFIALHTHMSPELREIVLAGGGVTKVHGIAFDPAQPEFFHRNGALYYNSWKGLADTGIAGDITPWWNHLCLLVPDEKSREHLLNWLAFTLQRPAEKINHCVVFGGNPGQGKDTLFWPLTQALGRHAKQVGADAFVRDFNAFLAEAKLVVVQEVDLGGRKEAAIVANRMKPVLADPPDTLYVNPKGRTEYYIRNVVHSLLFTNEDHPALVHDNDRRYFILVSQVKVTDNTGEQTPEWAHYFQQLWNWLDAGNGWRAVVGYLLTRDVSHFNPKAAPPMTEAKQNVIAYGRKPLESLLHAAIEDREGPFESDEVVPNVVLDWLATEGSARLQRYGVKELPSQVWVGRALGAVGARQGERVVVNGQRVSVWRVR